MARILLLLPTNTYRTEAFLRASRELGCEVVVGCEKPNAVLGREAPGYLALDFQDAEAAAASVEAFHHERPLDGVVPVDEDTAVVAAAVGARLGLPHNPVEAARNAADKHAFRLALRAAGLPGPRFDVLAPGDEPRLPPGLRFPVVVKPVHLSGSRGVMRADHGLGLIEAVQRLRALLEAPDLEERRTPERDRILIEELLVGPEVALEGILRGGSLQILALFDKPDAPQGPTFEETIYLTPSRLPPETARGIHESVEAAAGALGLREGPIHAELRCTECGPVLLELAARSIGGRCSKVLRFASERSLEEIVLRNALGMETGSLELKEGASGVLMLPVRHRGRLREVRGVDAARAVEGIEEVEITAHRGMELVPLPEGARYLGFVFAVGPTPEAVEASLRRAWERIEVLVEDHQEP